MGKIKKFFQELQHVIKLRGKKGKEEVEDIRRDEDEYEMDEEDKAPGNLKLNDGEHNPVYGVNKKIITGVVLSIVILVGIMFYTKYNEAVKRQMQENQPKMHNEEAFDSNRVKNKNNTSDYETLAKAGKEKAEQGKKQNVPAADNTVANNTAQPSQRQSANVPAMQQTPISAPYMLPSNYYAMQQPQPVQATIQKDKDEEPSLSDRFKSAISFAISTSQPENRENKQGQNNEGIVTQNRAEFTTASYYGGSDTILNPGTIIPAMLFTGINTDVAGQVTAQVQSDVYDSITGMNLLIPGGSKLIGSYDTKADSGRVNVTFSIIVLPDGSSYNVGKSLVAIDGAGYAGISGKINRHTGRVLGGGMAASALAALGSFASGNTRSDTSTYTGGQLAMQGAVANLMNNASKIFESGNNVAATIVIDPGYEFNVYVAQPVAF